MTSLAHTTTTDRERITVAVAGESDVSTADELNDVLLDAIKRRPGSIEVDLRGLAFADASSITSLIVARLIAEKQGSRFVATNPQPNVREFFRLTGVLDLLCGSNEPEDALMTRPSS